MEMVVIRWPCGAAQLLPSRIAAMAAGHSGAGPTFVEQDQPIGIKVKLYLEPSLALDHDIGALLYARLH